MYAFDSYYQTLLPKFQYSNKNRSKPTIWLILMMFSMTIGFAFITIFRYPSWQLSQPAVDLLRAIGYAISLVGGTLGMFISLRWTARLRKFGIDKYYFPFCYAMANVNELEAYLKTSKTVHLESIPNNFDKALEGIRGYYDFEKYVDLTKQVTIIRQNLKWINFSDETKEIVDLLQNAERKMKYRVESRTNLQELKGEFITLARILYFELHPEISDPNDLSTLKYFALQISLIDNPPENKGISVIHYLSRALNYLFNEGSLPIRLLSWFVVCSMVLFPISKIVIVNYFDLTIDNNGVLGIMASAITLSVFLAAKGNK